jgi:hypothetical protein
MPPAIDRSFYGESKSTKRTSSAFALSYRTSERRNLKAPLIVAVAIIMIIASFSYGLIVMEPNDSPNIVRSLKETTLTVQMKYQVKDNLSIPCLICQAQNPNHPAKGPDFCIKDGGAWGGPGTGDGNYGTLDDCRHCSPYCAPTAISMIANYCGITGPQNKTDNIYDNGKKTFPEIQGNNIIETDGKGMTDGTGGSAWEIQDAFNYSVGWHTQHNQSGATALTAAQLEAYVNAGHPVLWIDHNGWPANMSFQYNLTQFTSEERAKQGHAKTISGYNNNGTAGDTSDDWVLIHDPWPEYNDKGVLHANAKKGPGDTFDPYWYKVSSVLGDVNDKFLVDKRPDIPEFTTILIPIMGVLVLALVAMRRRMPEDSVS